MATFSAVLNDFARACMSVRGWRRTGVDAADHVPLWALGSAGAIERLPVLFGIGELVICADRDPVGMSVLPRFALSAGNATHPQRAIISAPKAEGLDHADNIAVPA